MASTQALAFLAQVREYQAAVLGNLTAAPSLEEMRTGSEAVMETIGSMPDGVRMEQVDVDGLSALWLLPMEAKKDSVILYFHGGGYVVQSANSHRKIAAHIAAQSGYKVLSVNYRLAPENPHPAAVTDAVIAYRWLLSKGFKPSSIGVAGDSAGGGLALALLLAAKRDGIEQPGGAVVFSPWVDLEGTGRSMDSKASVDLMVNRDALKVMASMFLSGKSPLDPFAAPLFGDFTGIAPIYIQVGGDEALLDDSTRLATHAAHANVAVRLDVFPEMQHVFQSCAGVMPEADMAINQAGKWFQQVLS